ncbi:ribonuclease III [bacterium]|nr:ribonuclease III [bacterium]
MQIPDFKNKLLLLTALTHRSAINEHATAARESNERLEYLGDAVLELVTTEFLYTQLPDAPEGKLTAIRSTLVKTTTLGDVARELGLGEMLYVSHGEEAGGGRDNDALLADTLEAVLGAIYLDAGFEKVRSFIYEAILNQFEDIMEQGAYKDSKSLFQELVQALGYETPIYDILHEIGPDHDKHFTVRAAIGPYIIAEGSAHSKQLAQQEAAEIALERLENDELAQKVMAAADDYRAGLLEGATDDSLLAYKVSPRPYQLAAQQQAITRESASNQLVGGSKINALVELFQKKNESLSRRRESVQKIIDKLPKQDQKVVESESLA